MKFFMKLFRALNSAQTPWQVTLAMAMAMVAGLTPVSGIQNFVILLLVFVLNIHLGLFFVTSAFFAGIGYLFDPFFEKIGFALLNSAGLKGLWTACYNSGLMRMTSFNNSLVLGSSVVALILSVPLYFLLGWSINHYRDALSGVLEKYPRLGLFGILKASKTKDPLFRWWGAGIFAGIAIVAAAIALILVDPAVKWVLERGGSSILQRDVRIGGVDVSLAQGAMAIDRIEVAGDKEGFDALSIDHAAFDLALNALLMNRTHIEKIAITGMGFNTPATLKKDTAPSSESQKSASKGKGMALPAFELPTPASILANADLKSVKASTDAQKEISEIIGKWDKVAKNDLSADNVNDLKKDFAALQTMSVSKDPQQLLKLKDAVFSFNNKVKAQQKMVTSLQEDFKSDRNRLEQLYTKVNQASTDDYNHLKSTYTLDAGGAINVFGLLFGDKIKNYLARARHYYAIIAPYLDSEPKPPVPPRGEGRWMKYPLSGPTANLWITTTEISGILNAQSFNATIKDISDNQKTLGRPVTLSAASDGPQISKLRITGEDNRLGDKVIDRLSFASDGVRLAGLTVDPIQINKSVMAFKGNITLAEMSSLSGNSMVAFKEAAMAIKGNDKTAKLLGDVLSSITAFKADVSVAGSLHEPQVKVSSDIDKQLTKALTAGLESQISEYQQELKDLLAKQTADQMASLKSKAGGLVDINTLAGDQNNALGSLSSDATKLLSTGGVGGALKGIRPF